MEQFQSCTRKPFITGCFSYADVLVLSSTGTTDESVGPWCVTVSTDNGGPASSNIAIDLTVVLDEGKNIQFHCANTTPLYGVSQATSLSCDYPCSLLFGGGGGGGLQYLNAAHSPDYF